MSAYFGNGYLVNILQRGASPVGKSRPQPTQAPVLFEKPFATTDNQPLEGSGNQTFEVQSESLNRPVEATAITNGPKDDPPLEAQDVAAPETGPASASFESLEFAAPPGKNASQPPGASDAGDEESERTLRSYVPPGSSEPSVPTSWPVTPSSSSERSGHPAPDESFPLAENPPVAQSANRVFELRMPENFFGQAKGEAFNVSQAETSPHGTVVAATEGPEAQGQEAVDHFSESSVPPKIQGERLRQPKTVITSKRPDELSEPQAIQLAQPAPILESQMTLKPTSVPGEVVNQVQQNDLTATRLLPEAFEAPAPRPRVEQPSEYLQLRQPPIAPAAVAPPPRLRINRLDIQVINHVPPPPPPTRAPDVSQLLEKKHLGRVELLL